MAKRRLAAAGSQGKLGGPHLVSSLAHKPDRASPLAILGLVALVLLAYAPSLSNEFTLDDKLASSQTDAGQPDRVISELHPPWFYFGQHYWAGEGKQSRLFRPVTILSYAYTYHAIGKRLPPGWEPFPHHLLNVLLMAWAACLALELMLGAGMRRRGAMLTAACFGVHAIHSEVVAGIVGRAELFSFCFGAAAILLLRRGGGWRYVSGALFFLALGSKESAIAWFPFVLCYDLVRRSQVGVSGAGAGRREWLVSGAVMGLAVVAFLLLRAFAIEGMRDDVYYTANPLYHVDVTTRMLTAVKVLGFGLWKCVVPYPLAAIYGPPALALVSQPADLGFLVSLLALGGWLALGLAWRVRTPLLFLSVVFFFGFSFLTSNLPLAIGTIFGERLYFIPSLGVCMLPAILLPSLGPRGGRVLVAVGIAWMAGNLAIDWQRSFVWHDNRSLILTDVEVHDCASLANKAATMHQWLADVAEENGDLAAAASHTAAAWRLVRRARQLDPDYVSAMTTEAGFHVKSKDYDQAIATLRAALAAPRLPISGLEAGICADLGMLLLEQKHKVREAVELLDRATQLRPEKLAYWVALFQHGIGPMPPKLVQERLLRAMELHPGAVMLWVAQAAFILEYGTLTPENYRNAAALLTRVFQVVPAADQGAPQFLDARLRLGDAMRGLGNKRDARAAYEYVRAAAEATDEQKQSADAGLAALAR